MNRWIRITKGIYGWVVQWCLSVHCKDWNSVSCSVGEAGCCSVCWLLQMLPHWSWKPDDPWESHIGRLRKLDSSISKGWPQQQSGRTLWSWTETTKLSPTRGAAYSGGGSSGLRKSSWEITSQTFPKACLLVEQEPIKLTTKING